MKLLRSICFTAALIAAGIGLVAGSASAIVLNNGLIVVHNRTNASVRVEMLTLFGHKWEGVALAPGGTFMTERCCYAAGSEYRLYVSLNKGKNIYFYPTLCNHGGIPYGFAEFDVTMNEVIRTKRECY